MIKNIWVHILFFAKYETFKCVVVDPENDKLVRFVSQGEIKKTARYCSHQGAPLEKYYLLQDGFLVCNWHGCRFKGVP